MCRLQKLGKLADRGLDEAAELGVDAKRRRSILKRIRPSLPPENTVERGLRTRMNNIEYFSPNFDGLVLGCIDADFCKQIRVGKLSPRSTQCTPLHRSLISIFSSKIANFLRLN